VGAFIDTETQIYVSDAP